MGRKKKRTSKAKRALKDKTKGSPKIRDIDEAITFEGFSKSTTSTKIERRKIDTSTLSFGRVIGVSGRTYVIEKVSENTKTDDAQPEFVECVPSRSIVTDNPQSTLVAVGDYVWFRPGINNSDIKSEDKIGIIMMVEKRRTQLARKAVSPSGMEQVVGANIDQLVIVMAADEPPYRKNLIDRYLVAGQKGELSPAICINKIDLGNEAVVRNDLRTYIEQLNVPTISISATEKINIESLEKIVNSKTSILAGPSGAGKSTIVNLLLGDEVQVTADVSKKPRRGIHTTTFARMFRLPGGGYILDTPGIREFGIWDISREELSLYFPEFHDYAVSCRFQSCTHTHEPNCAVKSALEKEEISKERYQSYVRMYESLPE